MSDLKQRSRWKREVSLRPGASSLVGLAFGSVVGVAVAFSRLDRASLVVALLNAVLGAAWGYAFWLTSDRARGERFQKASGLLILVAVVTLLLAYPDLRGVLRRAGGLGLVILFGGVCAVSMTVVAAGWGMAHLALHIGGPLRREPKPRPTGAIAGIWDPELDLTPPESRIE